MGRYQEGTGSMTRLFLEQKLYDEIVVIFARLYPDLFSGSVLFLDDPAEAGDLCS